MVAISPRDDPLGKVMTECVARMLVLVGIAVLEATVAALSLWIILELLRERFCGFVVLKR